MAYAAAQAAAKAAQDAQRAKQDANYQEAKSHADAQEKALSDDYKRRLAAYVASMRSKGDGGSTSGSATAYQDQSAGSAEKANSETGMVAVTEQDLAMLVQAVADIENARAWAIDLIQKDLAQ